MDIKGPVTFAILFSPPQKVMIAHVSSGQRPIAPLLIARFKGIGRRQEKRAKFPLTF
jgi:hypothetical protein